MNFIMKLGATVLGLIGLLGSKGISACFWFMYEPELPKKNCGDQ